MTLRPPARGRGGGGIRRRSTGFRTWPSRNCSRHQRGRICILRHLMILAGSPWAPGANWSTNGPGACSYVLDADRHDPVEFHDGCKPRRHFAPLFDGNLSSAGEMVNSLGAGDPVGGASSRSGKRPAGWHRGPTRAMMRRPGLMKRSGIGNDHDRCVVGGLVRRVRHRPRRVRHRFDGAGLLAARRESGRRRGAGRDLFGGGASPIPFHRAP